MRIIIVKIVKCSVSAVCAWKCCSWLPQKVAVHDRGSNLSYALLRCKSLQHPRHVTKSWTKQGREEVEVAAACTVISEELLIRASKRFAQRGLLAGAAQNRRRLWRVAAQHIRTTMRDLLLRRIVKQLGNVREGFQ
jgi:hypothetical protein